MRLKHTRKERSYAYGDWQVNWTLRSVAATAVFAAGAVASAYGATLSLDQARRTERHLLAEAGELQLLAEYASFMAQETASLRRSHVAGKTASHLTQYSQFAEQNQISNEISATRMINSVADSVYMPTTAMVSYDLSELKLARKSAVQRKCLAEAIFFEARSERRVGQMAVADVILNRVESSIYPDTICEVVYQGSERVTGCQFSFTCDGSMNNVRLTSRNKRWNDAQDMAGAILAGLHRPVSRQATHYHADYVDPVWAKNLAPTATIGTHKFYRFNNRSVDFAAPAGM